MSRERSVLSVNEVEEAIEWLLDNCEDVARAAAEREYYSKYKDSVLAIEASQSDEKSQAARENEARCSSRYIEVLNQYKQAVFLHELHKAKRTAKALQIDAWRTMEANRRAIT